MYRYMALMWSSTERDASLAAKFLAAKIPEVSPHKWSRAWDCAGLAIFHSGEDKGRMQIYRLQGERGAVLGRLFRTDYTSVIDDLDEFESRMCLETRGQHLVDNYWGRYVAFLNDPGSSVRYIIRDPTGAFPCLHTPFRGVTIYFSDVQDAANLDFLPFTVNWEFVKANIMLPPLQKTITGLNEVQEVLPAECVEVLPFETKSRFVWNPTEISQMDVVEDPDEASELLRDTVKNTIGALVGCYDRVLHDLGGLDSSIALACMARASKRPEITCVTNFTKSSRGDERYYSRQVARKHAVPLIELELDYRRAGLDRLFTVNKRVSPPGIFDCIGITGEELALAEQKDAQAQSTGAGGDNVFHQSPFNTGALDFVRRRGFLEKDALRVAIEASRYGGKSIMSTARDMLREYFVPSSCHSYVYAALYRSRKMPVVNPEIAGAGSYERFLHPMLIPNDEDPKGKYLQIRSCALHYNDYYDMWDDNYRMERLHLYFNQPIVESCLRIPIWVLTYGGVDRGLARKAFQHDLPQDVVRRYSKSTPAEFYRDIFKDNIAFLRDVLLDGAMVAHGVLLRDRLDSALGKNDLFQHIHHSALLGHAATEVWLRSWLDRPMARAAR